MTDATTEKQDSAISVSSSEESPVLRKLEVSVEAKRVGHAYDRAYKELSKQVSIRGFRKGKVPRSVLERMYGPSLSEQIEHTLVSETLQAAVEQVGIDPVTEPTIDAAQPVLGEDFRYTVLVEVKPQVILPDLAGLPAKKPKVEVGADEVLVELENLRQRQTPEVEAPEGTRAVNGSIVMVDFVGRVDGETFEGGTGRDVRIEIGSGQFIPGFEEQLIGSAAGDDCEISVTFPEDYGAEHLAGKEAVFAAHVDAVKTRVPPELDDDFAKDLEFDSLEDLRARIRDDLTKQREHAAKAQLRSTLMDSLIARTDFTVPPGLVDRELERQLHSAKHRLKGQVPEEAMESQLLRWREEWRTRAEREVREAILLEAVASEAKLVVTDEEAAARIEAMATQQGMDAAVLRKAYGEDGLERALKVQMGDEKAIEFLAAQAKVEETTDT